MIKISIKKEHRKFIKLSKHVIQGYLCFCLQLLYRTELIALIRELSFVILSILSSKLLNLQLEFWPFYYRLIQAVSLLSVLHLFKVSYFFPFGLGNLFSISKVIWLESSNCLFYNFLAFSKSKDNDCFLVKA